MPEITGSLKSEKLSRAVVATGWAHGASIQGVGGLRGHNEGKGGGGEGHP